MDAQVVGMAPLVLVEDCEEEEQQQVVRMVGIAASAVERAQATQETATATILPRALRVYITH